jgi:hypothetical protein
MSHLPAAMFIIYFIFLPPTLYCLLKHGKRGILGWFYLQLFCLVRIAGSAAERRIEVTHSTSSAGLILSSIGLSPLLLGTAGILHEA